MERKVFPENSVVAGQFRIVASYPQATFCGYLHDAVEEGTRRSVYLFSMHAHFSAWAENAHAPCDLFLPFRTGEQGGLRFLVLYSDEWMPYHRHLASLPAGSRAMDMAWWHLVEWMHLACEAGVAPLYLNPDMLFWQQGRMKALSPLPFELARMEAAVLDRQRFFSPAYLIHKNAAAKLSAIHHYFPLFVMMAEAAQQRPLASNSLTHQIDMARLDAGKYQPLLQSMLDVAHMEYEPEQAIYQACRDFLLRRLEVPLTISCLPASVRGTFQLGGRELVFPGTHALPHDSKNLTLVLPERVENTGVSGVHYQFVGFSPATGVHPLGQQPRAALAEIKAVADHVGFTVEARYRRMAALAVELASGANKVQVCKHIEVNHTTLAGVDCHVACDEPVHVRLVLSPGYFVKSWSVDGVRLDEFSGLAACELPPAERPRRIVAEVDREHGMLFAVVLSILALLAGGAALLYFLLQAPK